GYSGADVNPQVGNRRAHRCRGEYGSAGAVEEREKAVTQGRDLPTAEAVDHGADPLVVLADEARPFRIAHALEHRRRVADVGEHDRREHALADILGWFPIRMPARKLDRLPWDVALDPCQVSRRNLVGIARTDAELGTVVRPHGEPARNRLPP